MTEDMERIHHAVSGQVLQLANLASHAAELAVQLAGRRSMEAERSSRADAADVALRLRAERELAAVVWARSRSPRWLAAAGPDELVAVWASARAWAPLDTRAARAVDALTRRVADLGVDVDQAAASLDAQDRAALRKILEDHSTARQDGAPGTGQPAPAVGDAAIGWLGPEQEERVLAALRAEWSASTVGAVTADDAFGALASKLARLEDDGHEIAAVLRALPEAGITASDIRNPAAFAAWQVDRWAATGRPVHIAGQGWTRPAAEAVATAPRSAGGPARAAGRPRTRTTTSAEQRQQ